MRFLLCLLIVVSLPGLCQEKVATSGGYPISTVPFTAVTIDSTSFFGHRIETVKEVTIPLALSKCESEGRYDNFVRAAQPREEYVVGSFMGFPFDDTDVYKTLEGASYVLQTCPDAALEAYLDSVITIVGRAQEADGYLYTARTINPKSPHPWSGKERWRGEEDMSHELYNLGHLVDAACAHYTATGKTTLLDIARRYADCVCREVNDSAVVVVPGHQIAEMALARLSLLTGDDRYLAEAKFFLDHRGTTSHRSEYSQSHLPVIEQREAVGHAVRAGYMYAGMADVAALTGDTAYISAINAIWENIVSKKCYLTGGVGSRHDGEAFGNNYELPNLTAYNETCAAIAMVYLHQRMFLFTGQAKYIDCLERTLYNGVLSGMSLSGDAFFYPNPLAADGEYAFNEDHTRERQPWFGCACCPSNLCRFIPSIPGYMYAVRENNVYVNLFGTNTAAIATAKGTVTLSEQTDYPLSGQVSLTLTGGADACDTLFIRIPGWVRGEVMPSDLYYYADGKELGYAITVNGTAVTCPVVDGYAVLCRPWHDGDEIALSMDMTPRFVQANALVADDIGCVAIERGPLVYCAEGVDNSLDVLSAVVHTTEPLTATYRPELLQGIYTITAMGSTEDDPTRCAPLTLIPYYAWNHRGIGTMAVWMHSDD